MIYKKRLLALFLCAALSVTMFGACSKTDKTSDDSKKDTTTTSDSSKTDTTGDATATTEPAQLEPMEISVAIWGIQDAFDNPNAANDTIFNDLCKKFNVTIKPVGITWNDWQEKNKVWAASSTLPDVFVDALTTDNFGLYKTWAEQGIIKALPEDLSAYPNLQKLFSLNSVKAVAIDGKFYMVPRGNDLSVSISEASGMSRGVMYRKDWAAAAGYTTAPTTFDGLVEMTKAMMAQHPNAVGIAMNNHEYMQALATDIYPELVNYGSWVYENNQWIPSYASEKTVAYMDRLQKLYRDGLLDPDFVTQKDGDAVGKFASGNACVMLGSSNLDPQIFMDSNTDVANLEDAIGFITPFAAADGNSYVFTSTPYWSETYMSATIDDAKEQRILMMLDYMYSHEYATLIHNGIEGVDWQKSDTSNVSLLDGTTLGDKYPITASIGWLASWTGGFEQSGDAVVNSNPNIAAFDKMKNETGTYEAENCKAAPFNFDVFLMDNDAKSNISGLVGDFTTALDTCIIGSDDPQTAWDAMIKDFNSKGLQEAITSVTGQAADEGIQP